MNELINEQEIITIFQESKSELITLPDILKKINNKREFQSKKNIGKTALYNKLEKMTKENKIRHIQRKGYYLEEFSEEMDGKIADLFQHYKKLFDEGVGLNLEKNGELSTYYIKSALQSSFAKIEENLGYIFKKGMLNRPYNKEYTSVYINFEWASTYDICPICLEKIDLTQAHFQIAFERKYEVFHYTKCHLHCLDDVLFDINFFDRIKKKSNSQNEVTIETEKRGFFRRKRKPEENDSNENPHDEYDYTHDYGECRYCGLPTDIDMLFDVNYYKDDSIFLTEGSPYPLSYFLELSKELYGDVATMYWASKHSSKKYQTNLHKVVKIDDDFYHPQCGFKINKGRKGGDS